MAGTTVKGGKKASVAAVKPSTSPAANVAANPGKVLPAKKIPGPGTKAKK